MKNTFGLPQNFTFTLTFNKEDLRIDNEDERRRHVISEMFKKLQEMGYTCDGFPEWAKVVFSFDPLPSLGLILELYDKIRDESLGEDDKTKTHRISFCRNPKDSKDRLDTSLEGLRTSMKGLWVKQSSVGTPLPKKLHTKGKEEEPQKIVYLENQVVDEKAENEMRKISIEGLKEEEKKEDN